MRFEVLGPLRVFDGAGTLRYVPVAQHRRLLAALLLKANEALSFDELADLLWNGDPPQGARATLRNYMKLLRQCLGAEVAGRLLTRSPGYLVEVGDDELDLHQFTHLCERGRDAVQSRRWAEAREDLAAALAVWRGPAFADAALPSVHSTEGPHLAEVRLQALEWRIEADLQLGRHEGLGWELQRLADQHPLRERFWEQLMLTLYRTGRQSDALLAYQRARNVLHDELGVEPGFGLQALQRRILAVDSTLGMEPVVGLDDSGRSASVEWAGPSPGKRSIVPRELPAPVASFTGRAEELATLHHWLDDGDAEEGGLPTVVISAVSGTAGVGKTALAVLWAHRVCARFPDGQMYVNLLGDDPNRQMTSGEALTRLLAGLGVPGPDVPADQGERAGRYRTATAGRRLLIVLDNASSAEQVHPLLPGDGSSVVVVTSRDALAGLVARDGARRLDLNPLPLAEAIELLRRLIGPRVDAEPDAAARLAGQCARLPLALRVVAELALARASSLGELVAELEDLRRLDPPDPGGDPRTAVQAVFSLSARQVLPAEAVVSRPAATPKPAQLPLGVRGFAGREAELAVLDAIVAGAGAGGESGGAAVIVVSGTAGVGKTSLVVHGGHRVRGRFPDGQLYLNLHGFDPSGSAMVPAEAARRFLDALGVAPERIPAGQDAQVDLYRSLVADRRMLIVLDNARHAEQVRPLLPGAPGCLVLITSRDQLTSLVATEGAHCLGLGGLSAGEARQLLAARLGPDRVAAEPEAVEEIITHCAGLPLGLVIVAACAARPSLTLRTMAGDLTRNALDALHGGDAVTDIRAVFSWSYRTLSPSAARLFRLLGLHPGPDISAPAAAGLAGHSPAQHRTALAEITRANLLLEHAPGRYGFHDLLRAYARDLTQTTDTGRQRDAVTLRMLEYYLHTAHAADRLLYPNREPISLAPPPTDLALEQLRDRDQALDWFAAEQAVLLALVAYAAGTGWDTHAWQLAWSCTTFLHRRGHWGDYLLVQGTALAAGRRLADLIAQAHAHRYLGHAHSHLGRHDEARTHLRQALDLYHQAGHRTGQARAQHVLAMVWERQGRYPEALEHAQQALNLYRATGQRHGQADALNAVGWYDAQLGNYQQALTTCQDALLQQQQLGDGYGQADAWDSLGYAHHGLGDHTQAIDCYQHAIDLYHSLGGLYPAANTLICLGETNQATGDLDATHHAWRQALSILTGLDHPDAEKVRTKLHNLSGEPATPAR